MLRPFFGGTRKYSNARVGGLEEREEITPDTINAAVNHVADHLGNKHDISERSTAHAPGSLPVRTNSWFVRYDND